MDDITIFFIQVYDTMQRDDNNHKRSIQRIVLSISQIH